MIRNFIAKVTRKVLERRDNPRYKHQVPVKVWFEPQNKTNEIKLPPENLFVCGETLDLSQSGISFTAPAIRIRETYLVGENRALNAELDLPDGKMLIQIVGTRYEQIGEHLSTARYLVGARIVRIKPADVKAYEYFLHNGKSDSRKAGSLKLERDES